MNRTLKCRVRCRRAALLGAVVGVGLWASSTSTLSAGVHLVAGPFSGVTTGSNSPAINNFGVAIGNASDGRPNSATRWSDDATLTLQRAPEQIGFSTFASAINDVGTIVGVPEFTNGALPAVWTPGATIGTALRRDGSDIVYGGGGTQSYVGGISRDGQIVGSMWRQGATSADSGLVALRWDSTTAAPIELAGLPQQAGGRGLTYATSIGANGTVIGMSLQYASSFGRPATRRDGPRAALRWVGGSTVPQRLDDLSIAKNGDHDSRPTTNNAHGVVVGGSILYSGATDLGFRAVRWDADSSTAIPLETLSAKSTGYGYSGAIYVNDAGTVFGTVNKYGADDVDLGFVAVRWDAGGTAVTELGNLGARLSGRVEVYPLAFNQRGAAAGFTNVAAGSKTVQKAIFWKPGETTATDLNSYLDAATAEHWSLQRVSAMSDTGYVSGLANYDSDGPTGAASAYQRFYTLLVPEAGTYGQGDANFDTVVNFDDLVILAQHYSEPNASLATNVGDFNLDGVVNFDDLVPLAQSYNTGPGTPMALNAAFTADWALAQSIVPEPSAVGVLVALTPVRRRSKSFSRR